MLQYIRQRENINFWNWFEGLQANHIDILMHMYSK